MSGTLNTTTTQTLQTSSSVLRQVGTQLNNTDISRQLNLGNFVTNVSILPYIPSATIRFDAHGLKPNTRLYAYFDNVPVSAWCAPILEGYGNQSIEQLSQTAVLGTYLYSDAYGNCSGIFRIPPNVFKSQEITFQLTDIDDLSRGEGAKTTEADGVYYGSTLSVAKGQSLLNTRDTRISVSTVEQQKIVEGFAIDTQVTQQYIEDPPPNYTGGDDCGCGCFTGETLVTIFGGAKKLIKDIKVGDFVYNSTMTALNKVRHIEVVTDDKFGGLYSPSSLIKPFATTNHPLYIDGKLSSINPKNNYNWYPWLGKNEMIINCSIVPTTGKLVYNLWVDGDGTYIVNDYGTTSIIGDGGALAQLIENDYIDAQEVYDIMWDYLNSNDKNKTYGVYLFNKLLGRIGINFISNFFVKKIAKKKIGKKIIDFVFSGVGAVAVFLNR